MASAMESFIESKLHGLTDVMLDGVWYKSEDLHMTRKEMSALYQSGLGSKYLQRELYEIVGCAKRYVYALRPDRPARERAPIDLMTLDIASLGAQSATE